MKQRHDLDPSVAFSLLLEYLPGYAESVDDGGATTRRFLDDWYNDPSLGMVDFAQQWCKREHKIAELKRLVRQTQEAAYGDSNDREIDLLRDALIVALGLLGIDIPDLTDDEIEALTG